jgi:predicted nucleic acid-binding protein
MNKVLIDTDVLLDFFFDREPHSASATTILSLCEKGLLEGFITPVIISNLYYLLRKTARHEDVIKRLRELLSIIHILPMDELVVRQSLDSVFKDLEDALQNYAAVNSELIKTIITRNIKDYRNSEIDFLTPDNFVKLIFP